MDKEVKEVDREGMVEAVTRSNERFLAARPGDENLGIWCMVAWTLRRAQRIFEVHLYILGKVLRCDRNRGGVR